MYQCGMKIIKSIFLVWGLIGMGFAPLVMAESSVAGEEEGEVFGWALSDEASYFEMSFMLPSDLGSGYGEVFDELFFDDWFEFHDEVLQELKRVLGEFHVQGDVSESWQTSGDYGSFKAELSLDDQGWEAFEEYRQQYEYALLQYNSEFLQKLRWLVDGLKAGDMAEITDLKERVMALWQELEDISEYAQESFEESASMVSSSEDLISVGWVFDQGHGKATLDVFVPQEILEQVGTQEMMEEYRLLWQDFYRDFFSLTQLLADELAAKQGSSEDEEKVVAVWFAEDSSGHATTSIEIWVPHSILSDFEESFGRSLEPQWRQFHEMFFSKEQGGSVEEYDTDE